jgi:hypothetical protein
MNAPYLLAAIVWASSASSVLLLGCQGEANGECDHTQADLRGGWSAAAGPKACFASDRQMWIGDSASELEGPGPCTLREDACAFDCTDPDDGGAFAGTAHLDGGELTLEIGDCEGEAGECRATYRKGVGLKLTRAHVGMRRFGKAITLSMTVI